VRAYDFYLRAVAVNRLVRDTAEQRSNTQQRISLLNEAVARDPNFALAYCEIAKAHDILYRSRRGTTEEDRAMIIALWPKLPWKARARVALTAEPVHLFSPHFFATNNDLEEADSMNSTLTRATSANNAVLELWLRHESRGSEFHAVACSKSLFVAKKCCG